MRRRTVYPEKRASSSIYFLAALHHLTLTNHASHTQQSHMKFLIVDDSPEMRQMIGTVVTDKDDQILELDDGEHLVATYAAHRPDWVLIDIQMKHVGGLEATHQLKEQFPDARVIIITQYDDKYFRDQARTVNADAYILKDDISVLRDYVRQENQKLQFSKGGSHP